MMPIQAKRSDSTSRRSINVNRESKIHSVFCVRSFDVPNVCKYLDCVDCVSLFSSFTVCFFPLLVSFPLSRIENGRNWKRGCRMPSRQKKRLRLRRVTQDKIASLDPRVSETCIFAFLVRFRTIYP